ncbi:sclerotinia Sclerotiorum agglutinin Ssa in complex with Gal-Beta1,3-Galnac [Tricladium varicosporioides]|nr:sclerotinia Sclerotiorum agglutinin Ssa in complex with Gal-Beta1,3-Galnac [Hymenoscyphus varicosporioides]
MVFSGPGLYEIVSYQAPTLSLNSWGGSTNPGEVVKINGRAKPPPPTGNAVWQVALASGSGDTAQYLIINAHSGYFLTATSAGTIVSSQQKPPSDQSARWTIKAATTNNYQVYTINCVSSAMGQLNIKGGGLVYGTDVLAYPIENGDNTKFYFDPVSG